MNTYPRNPNNTEELMTWFRANQAARTVTVNFLSSVEGDYTPISIKERACSSMDCFGTVVCGTESYYHMGTVVAYQAPSLGDCIVGDDIPF